MSETQIQQLDNPKNPKKDKKYLNLPVKFVSYISQGYQSEINPLFPGLDCRLLHCFFFLFSFFICILLCFIFLCQLCNCHELSVAEHLCICSIYTLCTYLTN